MEREKKIDIKFGFNKLCHFRHGYILELGIAMRKDFSFLPAVGGSAFLRLLDHYQHRCLAASFSRQVFKVLI